MKESKSTLTQFLLGGALDMHSSAGVWFHPLAVLSVYKDAQEKQRCLFLLILMTAK